MKLTEPDPCDQSVYNDIGCNSEWPRNFAIFPEEGAVRFSAQGTLVLKSRSYRLTFRRLAMRQHFYSLQVTAWQSFLWSHFSELFRQSLDIESLESVWEQQSYYGLSHQSSRTLSSVDYLGHGTI